MSDFGKTEFCREYAYELSKEFGSKKKTYLGFTSFAYKMNGIWRKKIKEKVN